MVDLLPTGSVVSEGVYRCTNCGHRISIEWEKKLPSCPSCSGTKFETLSGGDSEDVRYPD